ncbi:hypothetical protein [Stieleria varia]|nr:hypothetical protein [Stieleria varia]
MSIFWLAPEKKAFFWSPDCAVFLEHGEITHRCRGKSPYEFIIRSENSDASLRAVTLGGKELSLTLNQVEIAVLEYRGWGNRELTLMGEPFTVLAKGGLSGTYYVPGVFELTMGVRCHSTLAMGTSCNEWIWTALALSYLYWFRFWLSD